MAKTYIAANKYLISDLQSICLHKIQRHLANLAVSMDNIDEIIELIPAAYANTSDEGHILKGTCDKLRELVITYVADRANVLLEHEGFRTMMSTGGDHIADYLALKFVRGDA